MRSCPRNDTVRNVFRASFSDPRSLHYSMFKICYNSYALGHTCPSGRTVRNVFRASPFGSAEPLGQACGRPVRQGRPKTPGWFRRVTIWAATVTQGCPTDLTSVRKRLHPNLPSGIFRRRERHAHGDSRRRRAGSGDRENPEQGRAKDIPGLPAMTGPP